MCCSEVWSATVRTRLTPVESASKVFSSRFTVYRFPLAIPLSDAGVMVDQQGTGRDIVDIYRADQIANDVSVPSQIHVSYGQKRAYETRIDDSSRRMFNTLHSH